MAKGPRIQTWINGEAVADIVNEDVYRTNPRGMIGLQIHKVKEGTGPYGIAWKNIRITELENENADRFAPRETHRLSAQGRAGWILKATGVQGGLEATVGQRLEKAGLKGGLIVCVGCADPHLLAALRRGPAYTVQGLDSAAIHIDRARAALREEGVYGPVSARHWDGKHLPYVDGLANALVVADATVSIPQAEIDRILAPRGVAIVDGKATVKPVPAEIDDWTHFLHGPDNNALAADRRVGPPRHIQWRAKPLWGRHHHAEKGGSPTVRTVVSAGGRLFVLSDQVETSNMKVAGKWTVTARDAFSGVLLWTTPVGTRGYGNDIPGIWRRIVADDRRVYTALGEDNMLTALDVVTGKRVLTYKGTAGMDELIKAGDTLYVLLKDDTLLALHAEDGKELWRWKSHTGEKVAPLTLAVAEGKLFLKTGQTLSCLSAGNGKTLYRADLPGATKTEDSPLEGNVNYPGKLVVGGGVVLCSYGAKTPVKYKSWAGSGYLGRGVGAHRLVREYGGKLGAFSASEGKLLWETEYLPDLQDGPGEIYIRDGVVWMGPLFGKPRDLLTGKVKTDRPIVDKLWTDGHHYRCYPGKATSNYIITAKRGIELIDIDGEGHSRNNWVRSTCQVGVTPCNGLLYVPPHSCGCYMEAKLFGFWALAGPRGRQEKLVAAPAKQPEKGPAYEDVQQIKAPAPGKGWWTYRGGNSRGGSTSLAIGRDLKQAWKTRLGGRLSAATVDEGKVFVAQVDMHTLHALDSATGKSQWSFTAGGRIDSPPTVANGLVLFGCRDGYVYCLRAGDGELAWRFRVAPERLQAVAFSQLESVWPVHGSVLYQDGTVYAAAGRSSYLDGGIRIVGLDPVSGALRCERVVRDKPVGAMPPPKDAGKMDQRNRQNWTDYKSRLAPDRSNSFSMNGARADILIGAHDSVFMRQLRFGSKLEVRAESLPHLFSTSELLDGWEHNRVYWVLGTGDFSGLPVAYPWIIKKVINAPVGLMMAFDERTVWVVARGSKSCHVVASRRPEKLTEADSLPDFRGKRQTYGGLWTEAVTIRPRAMLKAGDLIVIGGMPAGMEGNPFAIVGEAKEGPQGRLALLSAADGKAAIELNIDSPPVWDGLAAAHGALFVTCVDGSVVAMQ